MVLWLGLGAASLLMLLFVALRVPLSLSSNVQGRADPSGGWAIAWGLGLGPIALTAIAAAGVAPFVTCHVLGRQLGRLPLSRWVRRSPPRAAAPEAPPPATLSRLEQRVADFLRTVDPLEAVRSWWDHERTLEVRSLVVDVEYSFRDVALTGRTLAAVYVLSGVLPERYVINQTPTWEAEDRLLLAVDARFRIWPGRALLGAVGFVLKQRSVARRKRRASEQAAHST